MKVERKKKNLKKIGGNQAFQQIMEWLLGKGLERSECTSSIAQ